MAKKTVAQRGKQPDSLPPPQEIPIRIIFLLQVQAQQNCCQANNQFRHVTANKTVYYMVVNTFITTTTPGSLGKEFCHTVLGIAGAWLVRFFGWPAWHCKAFL
jgi:hypothetical protein